MSNLFYKITNALKNLISKKQILPDKIKPTIDGFYILERLKALGFKPSMIIDIGAHDGDWTKETSPLFPNMPFFLFEPLEEKFTSLKASLPTSDSRIFNVLLGSERKTNVPFYKMGTGSSVYEELTILPRTTTEMEIVTLDECMKNEMPISPILVKIDVQGFEKEVLKGGTKTCAIAEVIILEVAFLNFNKNAPLADEIISYMKTIGFVIYDFAGFYRKGKYKDLSHADIYFIKENSKFRAAANDFSKDLSMEYW